MDCILICIIVLIIALIVIMPMNGSSTSYVAQYAPKSQKRWWERKGWERFGYPMYSYWENFKNPERPANVNYDSLKKESPVLEFAPDSPSPADLYNNQPYHLLGDELPPPRMEESLSCVNSRSCYTTDFERMISKTGNYRQMTNNYKRGYPDSCSSPFQELVLNFYQADKINIPTNNTG